jgi:proteasome accessory factor B
VPIDRISKAQRWLDLIAYLLGRRRPVTVEQIFSAVPAYREAAGPEGDPLPASVRRMFERDKDELRTLGVPIETERFTINYGTEFVDGYVLRPDAFYLPYLKLVDEAVVPASPETYARAAAAGHAAGRDASGAPSARSGAPSAQEFTAGEVQLLLGALQEAAGLPDSPFADASSSAARKLSFDLGLADRTGPVRAEEPGGSEQAAMIRQLSEALLRRKRVDFRYHGIRRGEPTDRSVAPYGLFMERGAWYLVGFDELRDGIRVFHAGRMEAPRTNSRAPATADYAIPDDFDLSSHRDREAWQFGEEDEPVTARVRFQAPHDRWAARNGYGEPEETAGPAAGQTGGHASIRRFTVRDPGPFCDWILGLQGAADILEPPELRAEVGRRARAIAEGHR